MELIERYLNEVGRHLPRNNRKDILGELRSSLADALEDQAGADPNPEQVASMLKGFGNPRKIAATYYPEGQYLVGPTLYPFFRMVTGIALAAVLGAQIIAWLVSVFLAGEAIDPLNVASGLVNSLPATLGSVVIVFMILQRFDVHPDLDDKDWDPASLPELDSTEDVNRTEKVVAIIFRSIFMAILTWYSGLVGVYSLENGMFFGNPLIANFVPWLNLSLLYGIGLDVYLLWQGRWTEASRLARLAGNLFSIVILWMLAQAHAAWLVAHNATTLESGLKLLEQNLPVGGEIWMMQIFWMSFTIALIVTVIETAVEIFKMARKLLDR